MKLNTFVYHIKPKELRGEGLIPLNSLQHTHPDLYQEHYQKYIGREHLTKVKVPILDCLWNDVVHLSPIHPTQIRTALGAVDPSPIPARKWLKIPISAIQGLPATYFESEPLPFAGNYDFAPSCYRPFCAETYQELEVLPEWTVQYYHSEIAKMRRPLLFNGVPHILVKSIISLEEAQEIYW